MSAHTRTILLSLSTIGIGLITYQHLRLCSLYPDLPVLPQVDISNRKNRSYSNKEWTNCEVGDSWAVRAPLDHLNRNRGAGDVGKEWNRCFWTTWPLRLEGRLSGIVKSIVGSSYGSATGKEVDLGRGGFEVDPGDTLLNGLFTVESLDPIPLPLNGTSQTQTQITYSWGSLSPPSSPTSHPYIPIKGGYHTLSVLPTSSLNGSTDHSKEKEGDKTDYVYLVFTAQGVSTRSRGDERVGILDDLFISFHKAYSRVLIHLTIRNMGLSKQVERVEHWP
ncbi:hypothetical protein I302_101369 [Kwoniella bestiolae CBS 10118]|uniref:Uncharacterized protein n=1 Tax=Kwoniella bestiolae CBS 10118 TaxID=1296100 RepID=A0A1B9GC32_9TREE|nr:hypothetical protein I302_00052 [Kwoniella bestiolae CBS 10118]OCF28564.1 hypothetical protein I302_00052 [Kwoniella bestiolae CBS 10118]